MYRWNQRAHSDKTPESELKDVELHVNGFGSISRRSSSSKPMIAAVNGGAYGGGIEILLNCDIVIASEDATLALPEVKRGVVAIMGGMLFLIYANNLNRSYYCKNVVIPRLARVAGHQVHILFFSSWC